MRHIITVIVYSVLIALAIGPCMAKYSRMLRSREEAQTEMQVNAYKVVPSSENLLSLYDPAK